jgi:hypothetical protein
MWGGGDLELGESGWEAPVGPASEDAQQSFEAGDDCA